jgi:hypothetical protein
MKHLKKYNESINIDELIEYVKDCFIEFQDDSKYDFSISLPTADDKKNAYCVIKIDIIPTPIESDRLYSISKLVKNSELLNEFYLDVENSIDKVKTKHPEIYDECEEFTYYKASNKEGNKYIIINLLLSRIFQVDKSKINK